MNDSKVFVAELLWCCKRCSFQTFSNQRNVIVAHLLDYHGIPEEALMIYDCVIGRNTLFNLSRKERRLARKS